MHPLILNLQQVADQGKFDGLSTVIIRNQLKEVLQDYLLQAIYSSLPYNHLVFVGGTALRKLYGLNRMSEDLDFYSDREIDLTALGEHGLNHFHSIRFPQVEYSIQSSPYVHRITYKFTILHTIGLSPNEQEKLFVKIEFPAPTVIANTEVTLYSTKYFNIPIKHETKDSLMAGKMIACLERVWEKGSSGIIVKGRDYFDLIWYMQQNIQPDTKKLARIYPQKSLSLLFTQLDQKVNRIKTNDLLTDLQAFIPDYRYIQDWCQNFHQLYQKYRSNYL